VNQDPMVQFLLSGNAHVYYGLFAALGITAAVFMGAIGTRWLFVTIAIAVGIFVDLWVNQYEH